MARSTLDFAQQNTERAVQATNWMCAIAEQNLNQSKAAFDGLLAMARNAARGLDRQTCAICEQSIAAAEQTLENAFDFAHKVVRIKITNWRGSPSICRWRKTSTCWAMSIQRRRASFLPSKHPNAKRRNWSIQTGDPHAPRYGGALRPA
jgi:hypothetical protein